MKKKAIGKRRYLGPGHYGGASNLELAVFPGSDPTREEWPGMKPAMQHIVIWMNNELYANPDAIPAEIVMYLRGHGEHWGVDLDARDEAEL